MGITTGLFEKHGMIIIGFWETAIGDATTTELVYMLAFDNLAHYEQAWNAFIDDAEWQAAKRLTESDGPLVNIAGSNNTKKVTRGKTRKEKKKKKQNKTIKGN